MTNPEFQDLSWSAQRENSERKNVEGTEYPVWIVNRAERYQQHILTRGESLSLAQAIQVVLENVDMEIIAGFRAHPKVGLTGFPPPPPPQSK